MIQKHIKRLFITIAAIGAIAIFAVYCTNNPFEPQHNAPSATDFDISGAGTFTHDGTAKVVIVTAKESKTTGAITVKYDGNTTAPSEVGMYVITFDVAAAIGWNAVSGLSAGLLVITARPIYTLTVDRNPAAGGIVTVNGSTYTSPTTHNAGDSVIVSVTPSFGYVFTGWLGASSSTDSEITVIMSDNQTLTANFAQITYTLTVNSNPASGGTVTVNDSTYTSPTIHNIGDSVTVSAVPDSGYLFTDWSGASTSTSSEITVIMSDNQTLTANFKLGFIDARDGQTYCTVVMTDGKTWMSENLNYVNNNWSHNDVTGSIPAGGGTLGSWCYGNNASNCNAYGRLYTWDAATVACPVGWRLPTRQDWIDLVNAIGGNVAGTALKAQSPAWNGTNTHGFSALPGGYRWGDGNFDSVGNYGYWWATTEYGSDFAYRRLMSSNYSDVGENWSNKSFGFAVRCVRD